MHLSFGLIYVKFKSLERRYRHVRFDREKKLAAGEHCAKACGNAEENDARRVFLEKKKAERPQ